MSKETQLISDSFSLKETRSPNTLSSSNLNQLLLCVSKFKAYHGDLRTTWSLLPDTTQGKHHRGCQRSVRLLTAPAQGIEGFLKPDRKTQFNKKERFRLDSRGRNSSVASTNSQVVLRNNVL